MSKDNKWVELLRTEPMEGEIIRGKLESSGIQVQLKQEGFGKIAGITVNGLGEVKILIPEDKLDEAKEILKNTS
mgnify:CR=1 FL=1